jgi:hypothetical protein
LRAPRHGVNTIFLAETEKSLSPRISVDFTDTAESMIRGTAVALRPQAFNFVA